MDKRWKEELVSEIESYLTDLKKFKKVWSTEDVEKFFTKVKKG